MSEPTTHHRRDHGAAQSRDARGGPADTQSREVRGGAADTQSRDARGGAADTQSREVRSGAADGSAAEPRDEQHPYVRYGLTTGALGAFVVAFYFLIVDALAGRPLATPTALGATLFLGEPFDLERAPSFLLVLGYTAVHGAIFVGLASVASTLLLGAPRRPSSFPALAAPLFGGFFVAQTAAFLCFAAIFDIGIWDRLGGLHVAVANLLAAGAMAAALARVLRESRESGAPRRGERAAQQHAEAR